MLLGLLLLVCLEALDILLLFSLNLSDFDREDFCDRSEGALDLFFSFYGFYC